MTLEMIVVGSVLVVGVIFYVIAITVAKLLAPVDVITPGGQAVYESGMETYGPAWMNFRAGYFVYALMFVIFDIETAFLYPWAVSYAGYDGWFVFIEMFIFIGILALGLAYAWKEGALRWR